MLQRRAPPLELLSEAYVDISGSPTTKPLYTKKTRRQASEAHSGPVCHFRLCRITTAQAVAG